MQKPVEKSIYQKIQSQNTTYLGYVVALQNPLNIHLQIYWPVSIENKYKSCCKYSYEFISEELNSDIHVGVVYSCHLKGIEIVNDDNFINNMKEAYIYINKKITESLGWVLVSVGDIDVYKRILINMFDIKTRKSINNDLLYYKSPHTNANIAKEYIRPYKHKLFFQPDVNYNYNICYNSCANSNVS